MLIGCLRYDVLRPIQKKTPKHISQVSFSMDPHALSIFDAEQHRWVEQHGDFTASIGGGLADLRQRVTFAN